ncbi:glycoside hydrolase family 5 protein [Caldimonas brevitalea]|uniref:Endoglucanase n=1 Tax=Caldimonas brevitalea TaxID=413882 RepID=A0A0G3BNK7_9BURK|nr:glycoside hydrolase family 5 protein [Caldimonas brevitalea]AKJ28936.1 endoglucanase [Caldimonas brevitalea]
MRSRLRWAATAAVAATLTLAGPPASAFYVSDGQIYTDAGTRLTLKGVNWFGFETETRVVQGLWARNWKQMLDQMQSAGFNAVRIPVCPGSLRGEPVTSIDHELNPDLQGLNSLQVLDKLVAEMDRRGMYVLIDHHRPDCQAISELWYVPGYTEAQWIADLRAVAKRYKGYRHFLGLDLKNEPHGSATWGTGNTATDWNLAAERASKAVLAEAPNTLVFVEGIGGQSHCSTTPGWWWGGNLEPLACTGLDIPLNRLVLSPHVYGPDVAHQSYFDAGDFPNNLPAVWEAHFGRFANQGYAMAIGETGGQYGTGQAKDKAFQDTLFAWLKRKGIRNLFYWSWNPNSGDTGGILKDDWVSLREDKLALLRSFWDAAGEPPPPPPPPPPGSVTTQLTKSKDWGSGYCASVDVRNGGRSAVRWQAQLTIEGRAVNVWNAQWSQQGQTLTASGVGWNASVPAGGTVQFGFCADR